MKVSLSVDHTDELHNCVKLKFGYSIKRLEQSTLVTHSPTLKPTQFRCRTCVAVVDWIIWWVVIEHNTLMIMAHGNPRKSHVECSRYCSKKKNYKYILPTAFDKCTNFSTNVKRKCRMWCANYDFIFHICNMETLYCGLYTLCIDLMVLLLYVYVFLWLFYYDFHVFACGMQLPPTISHNDQCWRLLAKNNRPNGSLCALCCGSPDADIIEGHRPLRGYYLAKLATFTDR